MIDEQKLIDFIKATDNLGVDSATISAYFGIWRNEAVAFLSSLIEEGKLVKRGTRPILYFLPATASSKIPAEILSGENEKIPFSNMIGYDGSLAMQTQMALAASSYPPNGIHTLIVGETGVGKTLLACEMARHLKAIKTLDKGDTPFIMFNCAEYADNPQLLLSQLFGYAKGAFTGAIKDKEGLIEKADGGSLFLDEIHRLPPTGQEMLFTVIDKGVFRRMGDTADRVTHFMLIGATTEEPTKVLLNTFKRRMPLTIQIPVLSERPINERLDIISLFFNREANKLKLPIRVSGTALKLLVSCKGDNNIGDLNNEIQLACARAYLKHIQNKGNILNETELEIDIFALSRQLGIDFAVDERADLYFSAIGLKEGICYVPEETTDVNAGKLYNPRFTGFFDNQFKSLSVADVSPQETMKIALSQLEKQSNDKGTNDNGKGILYGSISPAVWKTTNEILSIAAKYYNKVFTQETLNSIAYFLQQLKAYANAERIVFSPSKFENVNSNYYDLYFVDKISPIINTNLHLDLMKGEAVLLSLLFTQDTESHSIANQNFILVGYGRIASSIAKYVNNMLNMECVIAFDVTEENAIEEMELKCSDYIKKNTKDTLVLAGLGTSSFIKKVLDSINNIEYCIIPYLDPMLALECGRIMIVEEKLDSTVAEILAECKEYFGISFDDCITISTKKSLEEATCEQNGDMRNVIITYCITGIGSARAARELLLKKLSVAAIADIIPLGIMDDIVSISRKLGKRLKLIIGIVNPKIPGVPFVNMEQIFFYTDIDSFLRAKGINVPSESELDANSIEALPVAARLEHCYNHLEYFSPSLKKEEVDATSKTIIENIEKLYSTPMSPDLVVRVYIHCCTMLERMYTAEPVPMPLDADMTIDDNLTWFTKLKKIMSEACSEMGVSIVEAEVYYFMMTLPTESLIINESRKEDENEQS